jgi:hypothetical protein
MSHDPQGRASDRFTSDFLTTAALQGWSEAGAVIEAAHRTPLPVGWTFWAALILLPAVVVCFLVH